MCVDWNLVSRVIPRDACMDNYGKLIVVRGRIYLEFKDTLTLAILSSR